MTYHAQSGLGREGSAGTSGSSGSTVNVRTLQTMLARTGCLAASQIDGRYGPITDGALQRAATALGKGGSFFSQASAARGRSDVQIDGPLLSALASATGTLCAAPADATAPPSRRTPRTTPTVTPTPDELTEPPSEEMPGSGGPQSPDWLVPVLVTTGVVLVGGIGIYAAKKASDRRALASSSKRRSR